MAETNEDITIHAPTEFTRYDSARRDPSTIDLVLSHPKFAHLIQELKVHEDTGSDHRPISFKIACGLITVNKITTNEPDFDKADWLKYQQKIEAGMKNAPIITHEKTSIDTAVNFITESIKNRI